MTAEIPMSPKQVQVMAHHSGMKGGEEYVRNRLTKMYLIASNALLFLANIIVLILNYSRI